MPNQSITSQAIQAESTAPSHNYLDTHHKADFDGLNLPYPVESTLLRVHEGLYAINAITRLTANFSLEQAFANDGENEGCALINSATQSHLFKAVEVISEYMANDVLSLAQKLSEGGKK